MLMKLVIQSTAINNLFAQAQYLYNVLDFIIITKNKRITPLLSFNTHYRTIRINLFGTIYGINNMKD
jgi:hypothetical protein